jgi:hypothetical protein
MLRSLVIRPAPTAGDVAISVSPFLTWRSEGEVREYSPATSSSAIDFSSSEGTYVSAADGCHGLHSGERIQRLGMWLKDMKISSIFGVRVFSFSRI